MALIFQKRAQHLGGGLELPRVDQRHAPLERAHLAGVFNRVESDGRVALEIAMPGRVRHLLVPPAAHVPQRMQRGADFRRQGLTLRRRVNHLRGGG